MPKGGDGKYGKRMMDVKDDIKPGMGGPVKSGVKRPVMARTMMTKPGGKKSSKSAKRSGKRA